MVKTTWLEAYEAVREAEKVGHPLDRKKIDALAAESMDEKIGPVEWMKKWHPCIFLREDGACGVYRGRPLACRSVLVISPPDACAVPEGSITKLDTGSETTRAYVAIRNEHLELALAPVMAPMPMMVKLVLDGQGPASLLGHTNTHP